MTDSSFDPAAEAEAAAPALRAVLVAACHDDLAALERALQEHPGLVDAVNINGLSPLMIAAAAGARRVTARLAPHALVDINRADANGMTALHLAAAGGHGDVVALLLAAYVDFTRRNSEGQTAVDLADDAVRAAFAADRRYARASGQPRQPAPRAAFTAASSKEKPAAGPAAENPPQKTPPDATKNEEGKIGYDTFAQHFVAAAAGGDALQLETLEAQCTYVIPRRLLDTALRRSLEAGDHPAVVHRLVRWGAHVEPHIGSNSIARLALTQERPLAMEQIMAWSPQPPTGIGFSIAYHAIAISLYHHPNGAPRKTVQMIRALAIALRRKSMPKKITALKKKIAEAAEERNISTLQAALACLRAREQTFLRALVKKPKRGPEMRAAFALFADTGRFDDARALLAEGYRPAAADIDTITTAAGRAFFTKALAGKAGRGDFKPRSTADWHHIQAAVPFM